MKRLILYALLLLACKTWDIYATWLRSPDLKREMNPVIRLFGAGWTGMFTYEAVLIPLTLWFVSRSLTPDRSLQPVERGLPLREFISHMLFVEPAPWWHTLYRMPTRRGATFYILSGIALFAAPLIHIEAGTSNWLLTRSRVYEHWFDSHLPWSWVGGAAVVTLASIVLFVWRDYAAYRKLNTPAV